MDKWISRILQFYEIITVVFTLTGTSALTYFMDATSPIPGPWLVFYGILIFACLLFIFNNIKTMLSLLRTKEAIIKSFFNGSTFAIQDDRPLDAEEFRFIVRSDTGMNISIYADKNSPSEVLMGQYVLLNQQQLQQLVTEGTRERLTFELLKFGIQYQFYENKIYLREQVAYSGPQSKAVFFDGVMQVVRANKIVGSLLDPRFRNALSL